MLKPDVYTKWEVFSDMTKNLWIFPPNYKRTEDLSDIDSVASSVHSTLPSS